MMVMMMTQSKGGQLTSQVIIFLTGLVGVNRKSEVGPRSSGSSFFFFLIPAQSCLLLSRLKALKSPFGPYHHMTTCFTVRSYDHSPSPCRQPAS